MRAAFDLEEPTVTIVTKRKVFFVLTLCAAALRIWEVPGQWETAIVFWSFGAWTAMLIEGRP